MELRNQNPENYQNRPQTPQKKNRPQDLDVLAIEDEQDEYRQLRLSSLQLSEKSEKYRLSIPNQTCFDYKLPDEPPQDQDLFAVEQVPNDHQLLINYKLERILYLNAVRSGWCAFQDHVARVLEAEKQAKAE